MSTKDAFDRAWFAQFSFGADDTSPPLPSLSCWDSAGNLRSPESLRDELDKCRRRIAELRRSLRAEEFIEFYCQQELNRQSASGSKPVAKRSASLPCSTKTLKSSETSVQVEGIYSEPIDSRLTRYTYCESPEGLYSEPVDAKSFHRIPTVPETVYATPAMHTPVSGSRRVRHGEYEEIDDVRAEAVDSTENSSDDESVANLVAIRQSVSRLSQWCVDGDAARKKLEMQAKRLSSRYSHAFPATVSDVRSNGLDSVPESLLSPTTPSAPMDLLGGSVGMTVAPSLLGIYNSEDQLDQKPSRTVNVLPSSSSMQDMRRWIVMTLLDSERTFVTTLSTLLQLKQTVLGLMSTAAVADVEATFDNISKLYETHHEFVTELDKTVSYWSPQTSVGSHLKTLAASEYSIAPEYLKTYQRAIAAINHSRQDNPTFEDVIRKSQEGFADQSSLEDLLQKPVIRFERNTLVLHDLIKYTPTGHADYDLLQKTLKLAQHFLENLVAPETDRDNVDSQRYLVKHGLIVEKIAKERKLRHVFLFNDMIVAAKQKIAHRHKDQYEVKWFIPLVELSLEDRLLSPEDKRLMEDHKREVDTLQRKVSELQADYKQELKKAKDLIERPRLLRRNKSLERVRKKLLDHEVALVIAMPHLQFRVYNRKEKKHYLLMMSSDYERSDWRDAIAGLLEKAFTFSLSAPPAAITLSDVQSLLGKQKTLSVKQTGAMLDHTNMYIEEEKLYGSLHVIINKLQGLTKPQCTFCRIEVDSFGHFLTKAKTNVLLAKKEPTWNDRFELDLDGAQTLRVLCYSQQNSLDSLIGKGAVELSSMWLKDEFQEHVIALNNELSLSVSVKYLSQAQTNQSHATAIRGALFGACISSITSREGRPIPLLLTSCIHEIESRGLDEEGLYRISGRGVEVDELKQEFESNLSGVVAHKLKSVGPYVLASLVKLFFRSLPDPLFTEALYTRFAEGIGLADPDAKDNCLLALVHQLPKPNFDTTIFLLNHLLRVSEHENHNKMGLKNLATVFGPTLLRPPSRNSQPKTMEQLFCLAAHETAVQVTAIYQLLLMKSRGVRFETSPTAVTRC